MVEVLNDIDRLAVALLALVGGLHMMATGLEVIVKLTPTTKDDKALAKVTQTLETASRVLRQFGLEFDKLKKRH